MSGTYNKYPYRKFTSTSLIKIDNKRYDQRLETVYQSAEVVKQEDKLTQNFYLNVKIKVK